MAQWLQLQQLSSAHWEQVSQLYDETFPMEIRQYLSAWIESEKWDLAAEDVHKATDCFHEFLRQLEEQRSRFVVENNILQQHNFRRINQNLQYQFQEDPLALAMIISKCLNKETNILASAIEAQDGTLNNPAAEKQKVMDNKVKELRKQIWEAERDIKSLDDQREELDYRTRTLHSGVEQLNGLAQSPALQKQIQDATLLIKSESITLNQTSQMVTNQIDAMLNLAEQIVFNLLSVELPEWKRRQQQACIGGPLNTCLDQLQMWFTTVAEGLQQVRQQLKNLAEQEQKYASNTDLLTLIKTTFEERTLLLFKSLLVNALVVERQPRMTKTPERPLILKTGNLFKVKIRFLVKLPELNYHLKVKPVFDKDVSERTTIKGFRKFSFDGKNNNISKVLNLEDSTGGLAAEFGHLSLKEQKQGGNRSNESPLIVTEELHVITFETKVCQPGLEVDIETSTLPLVVVSSSSQNHSAWASIMWYNMLTSEPKNLSFFLSPPLATWQQLSEVLSWQFSSISKRGLNADQLSTLRDKLVGSEADNPDGLVHWAKFCKNDFWVWIEGILDLIKKYLLDIWNDGSIMGFVSRETAECLLKAMPTGTFLLRFSESSKDGAVTFSWVEHFNGDAHVHAVEPYTKKDLTAVSLPNMIDKYLYNVRDPQNMPVNPLHYLYPDIPKDIAFQRYYSKPESLNQTTIRGYVTRDLMPVTIIKSPSSQSEEPTGMDTLEQDTLEQDTLEQYTPEQYTPGQDTPEQYTPGQDTPEQYTLGQDTLEQYTTDQYTLEQMDTFMCAFPDDFSSDVSEGPPRPSHPFQADDLWDNSCDLSIHNL